ncbi:MAG TPA: histidine kinase dimerization/phospho-acceptor domain-containing protein [Pyrinomonadaceae bacterium]|nr:histidine kinase dimerization/phospho-acceptor domain-containing protein [Pyrinomonadaceae bacterium]
MAEQQAQANNSNREQSLRDEIVAYEAKINEIAEIVARVRHEINNPLTGVLGQAQLLLREELNERARKRVETIEDLALRLRDIVAVLRTVQRPAPRTNSTGDS